MMQVIHEIMGSAFPHPLYPIAIRSEKAFTLLELLIATAISAVIAVMVYTALNVGTKAWERGETGIEQRQRQRVVLALLREQLSSIYLNNLGSNQNEPLSLSGEPKSMRFLSQKSILSSTENGLFLVEYRINPDENTEKEWLGILERNIAFTEKKGFSFTKEERQHYTHLIAADRIDFTYLPISNTRNPEKEAQWTQDNTSKFPLAVRVTFDNQEQPPPLEILVRIEVK